LLLLQISIIRRQRHQPLLQFTTRLDTGYPHHRKGEIVPVSRIVLVCHAVCCTDIKWPMRTMWLCFSFLETDSQEVSFLITRDAGKRAYEKPPDVPEKGEHGLL
jgi:hypothetical protein